MSHDIDKTIRVSKLRNGSVVDHLKPGTAFEAMKVLGLTTENVLAIGMNYESKKYGKKDILKIENRTLTRDEINKLAIISPNATYCIIKEYQVKEKIQVVLPDILENIVKCNNSRCITVHEKIPSKFYVLSKCPLNIRCYYCEKKMSEMELDII